MPPVAGCIQNASLGAWSRAIGDHRPGSSPALDCPASNRYAAIFQLFADVLLDFLPDLAAPGLAELHALLDKFRLKLNEFAPMGVL